MEQGPGTTAVRIDVREELVDRNLPPPFLIGRRHPLPRLCIRSGFPKPNRADGWGHYLRCGRLVIRREFVMGKLEDPRLSDNTVDRVAVRTSFSFSALLIYSLADLSPLDIIDVRSAQLLQKGPSFGFSE